MEHGFFGLSLIVALGIGSIWLASRIGVPSILVLLLAGFLAGPVLGWIHPDDVLGAALFPMVGVAVAVVVFEGALSLRFRDIRGHGVVVTRLVTGGMLVTWAIATIAAHFLFDMEWRLSFLLGAIVVVSGPTVVGPLLRQIRPSRNVGAVLEWESIVIDPIGVLLAVLVFEAVVAGNFLEATLHTVLSFLKAVGIGTVTGLAGAALLGFLIARYKVRDDLQAPVALGVAVFAFGVSDLVQGEAGLLAVVVMGIALANQRRFSIEPIKGFKEALRVILIGVLFVTLAGRIEIAQLQDALLPALAFLGILVFVARPATVVFSAWKSNLTLREQVFLCFVAPRGIVAAAGSAVFALGLEQAGFADAGRLLSTTFLVIVGSVAVYGLSAPFAARWLGVSSSNRKGALIAGASPPARAIARALGSQGVPVLLIDSNPAAVEAARSDGLTAFRANFLSEYVEEEIDLGEYSTLFAMTSNDEANALACQKFAPRFGSERVFRLRPAGPGHEDGETHAGHGRLLFDADLDRRAIFEELARGATGEVASSACASDRAARPLFSMNRAGQVHPHVEDGTKNCAAVLVLRKHAVAGEKFTVGLPVGH